MRILRPSPQLELLEPYEIADVVCLGCGSPYRKPTTDDVWLANPGCPRCGYTGWADYHDAPEGHRLSSSRIAIREAGIPLI